MLKKNNSMLSNYNKYPSVVLLGEIGSGKTTLLNKICNSQEKTKSGGSSVTRNIFLKASAYGNGFLIMDTPGYGSDVDQLAHICAIYTALIEKPLNRIMITVRFDRTAKMRKSILEILNIFERYKNLIVIIVTCWDEAEDPIEDEKEIKKDLILKLGLNNYILSGKNITGEQICFQIDKFLINSTKENLEITQMEFLKQYDLANTELYTLELKTATKELKNEFQVICEVTIKYINDQDGKSFETAELMHAIIVGLKNYGHTIIEQFQNSHGLIFDKLVKKYGNLELAYLLPMHLKKAVTDQMKEVIDHAQDKMKIYPYHIFNFIKQCDNCGLIWLKVSGCPNTTCGAFPPADDDNFQPNFLKYKVTFSKAGVKVEKQTSTQNKKQYIAPTADSKYQLKGCGKKINWDDLPPLPNEIIEELKNTGFLDFLRLSYENEKTQGDKEFWNLAQMELNKQQEEKKVDLSNLNKLLQK